MKKIIAKLFNATRDTIKKRRMMKKEDLKVGKIYYVKHAYREDGHVSVTKFNDVWVWGHRIDSTTMVAGEEIILFKKLCIFKELEGQGQ